jgi:hypothetical protein
MKSYILREGVLNDDYMNIADNGKVFKGGYIAIIYYYTYANEWSNREHVVSFRKHDALQKYLSKYYSDFTEQIEYK